MNRIAVGLFAALAVSLAAAPLFAEDLTPEQIKERRLRKSGGTIVDPRSFQGRIAVFNGQKRVSTAELSAIKEKVTGKYGINCTVEDAAPATVATAAKLKADAKAGVAIFVVDDPALPMSLVAYEDHWGFVNVAKLDAGADKVKLFGRTKAELARVIALASGGGDSMLDGSILRIPGKPEDLDKFDGDISLDIGSRMLNALKLLGVTPMRKAYYRTACKQGWAPAPTNDIQKAIWDEICNAPTNPIEIKFDPKRDAGK